MPGLPTTLPLSHAAGRARLAWLEEGQDARLIPGTTVWHAERDRGHGFLLHCVPTAGDDSSPAVIAGRVLVLATGAYDVALPVPGWDLPGVMTAGGAQALLKGTGTLPGKRVLVAGSGPFLLPVAAGILAAGGTVAAVVEAASPARWIRHPAAIASHPGVLAEAARYAAALAGRRVAVLTRRAVIAVGGPGRVAWADVDQVDDCWQPAGRPRRIEADAVCLSFGFVPSTELALSLGCAATVRGAIPSAAIDVDDTMRTGQPGIYAAGEITGVGGSGLAEVEGLIAGLSAAREAGADADTRDSMRRLRRRRRRLLRFSAALDDVSRLRPGWASWVTPATVVCRCEEVTVAGLRRAAADFAVADARTLKMTSRLGMGRCQGRMCGHLAAGLLGAGPGPASFANRPVAFPVSIESLIKEP